MALPSVKRVTKRITVLSHYACPRCKEPVEHTRTSWGTRLCTEDPISRTFYPCGCMVFDDGSSRG